jgi:V/A-type H+-transporting ATPase subunit E
MNQDSRITGSGVQQLITRIRDQGVQAGQDEAERVLAEARQTAAQMIEDARTEIDAMRKTTEDQIRADEAAAIASLRVAARDTGLELESAVLKSFERQVHRLVSDTMLDGEFLRALVLVLAGQSVDEYISDKDIQILVAGMASGEEIDARVEERAASATLAIASGMLREGVELIPADDLHGGVRVRIVDEKLEIDLTGDAISRLLLRHLLPRFRAILSGAE